jgi:hypothetical protein
VLDAHLFWLVVLLFQGMERSRADEVSYLKTVSGGAGIARENEGISKHLEARFMWCGATRP